MEIALLAFAAIFFVVGLYRIVEFKAAGISLGYRRVLIPLHIVGNTCFSGAMVLFALDPEQQQRTLLAVLFFTGLLILFPMHIFVNLKRRIKVSSK